jgi:flagellin
MASILTNNAATAALQTLRTISSSMEKTQNAISTGQRVAGASDDAAYWSIATTMRSDSKALGAVQDALGLGAAKVDTAYTGIEAAIDVVKSIKAKLVTATEESADKTKIQAEVKQLQDQLVSIVESSSFNGQNWLGKSGAQTVVTGFVRTGANVAVKTETYTASALFAVDATTGVADKTTGVLADVAAITLTAASTPANVKDSLDFTEVALTALTTQGSNLGSLSSRISLQEDFVGKLSDSIDKGIGRLVDADMNEESTRLKALQTQQQLAIQALSIANSDSQNILSLFR